MSWSRDSWVLSGFIALVLIAFALSTIDWRGLHRVSYARPYRVMQTNIVVPNASFPCPQGMMCLVMRRAWTAQERYRYHCVSAFVDDIPQIRSRDKVIVWEHPDYDRIEAAVERAASKCGLDIRTEYGE